MESASKTDSKNDESSGQQDRSTIQFPYLDLDAAIEVARGVHNAGGTTCDTDQLAAQLKMEAKGGGFRMRVNGAQTFGLVNYERGGRVNLTELGRQIVDPKQERLARMTSFLTVELFARVYDEYKGGPLPPQPALERAINAMGVGSKVKDRARQTLMRSAKQAGFFEQAPDRLIKPIIRAEAPNADEDGDKDGGDKVRKGGGNGGDGDDNDLHPLVKGLLVTLPKPGTPWSAKNRVDWLSMANFIFRTIYTTDGEDGEVTVKIESGSNKENADQK